MATNYKQIIEGVLAQFADQIVADGPAVDNIGRRLLPHLIDAMPANERANWGVLEKRTSKPWYVPYDILVWKPTREHFDVLTSKPLSGDKNDTTGSRRLIGTWIEVGVLPKATWHWCEWNKTATPIVPLAHADPPPPPPPDPKPDEPPPPPNDHTRAFEIFIAGQVEKFIALMIETRDGLAALRK